MRTARSEPSYVGDYAIMTSMVGGLSRPRNEKLHMDADELGALRMRAAADHGQHSARGALRRDLGAALRLAEQARKGRGRAREDWKGMIGSGALGRLLARAEGSDNPHLVCCLPSLRRIEGDPMDRSALDDITFWIETHARYWKGRQGRRRELGFFLALHAAFAYVRLTGTIPKIATVETWHDGEDDVVSTFDVGGPFVDWVRSYFGDEIGERALRDAVRDGRFACENLLIDDIDPAPYRGFGWAQYERSETM